MYCSKEKCVTVFSQLIRVHAIFFNNGLQYFQKRREEILRERKYLSEQKSKGQAARAASFPSEQKVLTNVVSVPPLLDSLNYPSEALNNTDHKIETLPPPG